MKRSFSCNRCKTRPTVLNGVIYTQPWSLMHFSPLGPQSSAAEPSNRHPLRAKGCARRIAMQIQDQCRSLAVPRSGSQAQTAERHSCPPMPIEPRQAVKP
jgi:hypothetical protein